MMRKLVLLMIAAMVASTAGAAVINVNMYASNGGYVLPEDPATLEGPAGGLGTTWNQFNTKTGDGLLDSSGVVTTVGFSNNVGTGWGVNSENTELTALKSSRALFGKGADTTHTITGLEPGGLYNIWIASYNRNSTDGERALGEWSTSNSTTTVGPQMIDGRGGYYETAWEYGVNYVMFENVVADASGQVVLIGDAADGTAELPEYGETFSTRLHLNAWQIEEVILPTNPSPGHNETVGAANPLTLSWTNIDPDPNSSVAETLVNVWFGTDPCTPGAGTWEKVVDGQAVSSVNVDASAAGTYYWRVDSDNNDDPNFIEGLMWTFDTTADVAPTVAIDTPDQMTWSGEPAALTATINDDGASALTIQWTADPADGVTMVDEGTANPMVVINKPADGQVATVTMTVSVSDAGNPTPVTDTVQIDVYDDDCHMARVGEGLNAATDLDNNCITNIADLAIIAGAWLEDYSSTGQADK